jgi:hypothetical protein
VGSVYTRRLGYASGGSQTQSFVVPAGRVWVVKNIILSFTGPAGAAGIVFTTPPLMFFAYAKNTANPEIDYRDITQPLTAGETLGVQIVDPNNATTIVVAGYDFDDS